MFESELVRFQGSNSSAVIFVSLLFKDQLLKERENKQNTITHSSTGSKFFRCFRLEYIIRRALVLGEVNGLSQLFPFKTGRNEYKSSF